MSRKGGKGFHDGFNITEKQFFLLGESPGTGILSRRKRPFRIQRYHTRPVILEINCYPVSADEKPQGLLFFPGLVTGLRPGIGLTADEMDFYLFFGWIKEWSGGTPAADKNQDSDHGKKGLHGQAATLVFERIIRKRN